MLSSMMHCFPPGFFYDCCYSVTPPLQVDDFADGAQCSTHHQVGNI